MDTLIVLPYSSDAKSIDVFDSNNNFILSVDVSHLNPVDFVLGYGGDRLFSVDYNVTHTLIAQPTEKFTGQDFNVLLGWSFYGD